MRVRFSTYINAPDVPRGRSGSKRIAAAAAAAAGLRHRVGKIAGE